MLPVLTTFDNASGELGSPSLLTIRLQHIFTQLALLTDTQTAQMTLTTYHRQITY